MKPLLVILAIVAGVALYLIIRRCSASRGAPTSEKPSAPARDVRSLVEPFARPAFLITKTDQRSTSYLGGAPPRYPGFVWPQRGGRPLSFLACLDLEMAGDVLDWLPRRGLLLFFYDTQEQPWGFDPKDRGGWAVVHVPEGSVVDGSAPEPAGLGEDCRIERRFVRFEAVSTPPSWDHEDLADLDLSDEEQENLIELRSAFYGEDPAHQLGGYPDPVQNPDMALECQLASHGLYCGDSTGYADPRAEALKAGAVDWRLLLQIDSDDELDFMWGDLGMLYFWVRAQEAKQGDFSNAWLVLQCH